MTIAERDQMSAIEIAKLEGRMDAGFAEVGGKLDTLIAKYEAADENRRDDRALADKRYLDHEERLRQQSKDVTAVAELARAAMNKGEAVEANTVSHKKLWVAFGTVAMIVIAAAGVIVSVLGTGA